MHFKRWAIPYAHITWFISYESYEMALLIYRYGVDLNSYIRTLLKDFLERAMEKYYFCILQYVLV